MQTNCTRLAGALLCFALMSWSPKLISAPFFPKTGFIVSTDEWILAVEKTGVKAYYRIATCGEDQVIYLRFVNSNAGAAQVSWKGEIQFTGEPVPRSIKEENSVLTVQPGEVAGTSCINPMITELVVKPLHSPIVNMEAYFFQQLTITQN
ncbi:hypothetical protein [Sediminibacterium goheungense]|uniref:Uncharacterized protein n=1 Tax=Sediminibacterium goheungense TaxID=1086393 RepID=A0A4R6IJR5_9BACT|nr:hypothetical protein [Sediminibacterium goheungense]TDO22274.1 hypothetical protein BC659_3417 [Sediminibacterium goheungense]